jgi:hypothetical protein
MKKKEIIERLENIEIQIKSNDVKFKSHALFAFIDLISKTKLDFKNIKFMKAFLKENIADPYSSLKTDSIKAASIMILQDSAENEDLISLLLDQLKDRNKFRLEIILDMLSKLSNSNNKRIQEAIIEILEKTPQLFDQARFETIIENFWKQTLEQNHSFIDKYKDHMKRAIKSYPEEFSEIRDHIYSEISDHMKYIDEIKNKRRRERKLREEKLKKRKDQKTDKEREEEIIYEEENQNKPKKINGRDINRKNTTFSGLGLKRKDEKKD